MRTTSTYAEPLGLGYLQIVYNYGVCADFDLSDGWNMISLPLEVADANYLTLFPNANAGSLFEYSINNILFSKQYGGQINLLPISIYQ